MPRCNQKSKLSKQEEEQLSSALKQLVPSMLESIDNMLQRLKSGHLLLSDSEFPRIDLYTPRKQKAKRKRK